MIYSDTLPYSIDAVWDYHRSPGAVHRLMPGRSRLRVRSTADSLRDGTTLFDLPIPGLQWRATHDPSFYADSPTLRRFADDLTTPGLRRLLAWRHEHTFSGDDQSTTVTDQVTARFPRRITDSIFAYRRRQLRDDLAFLADLPASDPLTVAVTGSSGLVGTQVVALLQAAGHRVIRLERSPSTTRGRYWNPEDPAPDLLEGVDVLIHLAGHPIGGRFTEEHIAAVRDSRVGPTAKLSRLVTADMTMVCASAVGFYGYDRPTPADESAPQGEGILAEIVAQWEAAAQPAGRLVTVRSGLVLAGGSPLLDGLRASVLLGGGRLGDGTQHFPWIALDDIAEIYVRGALDASISGIVNAVAPETVTNAEFTRALGGWPVVPIPAAAPALLLGADGARELALADQHVVSRRLQHRFRFPDLDGALRHELS